MTAELALVTAPDRPELDIDLIKRTICKGSTDEELRLFVGVCQRTGLDPFLRQIHAIKRWDSSVKQEVLQPMIAIDGFRLMADRTGRYVPGREPSFAYDDKGRLLSATAYVKVHRHGDWHECAATAMYGEYVQTTREGAPNSMWQRMPHSQLAKCAESLCLRKAFPAELSGLYTTDEMGQADNHAPVASVTTDEPAKGPTVNAKNESIDETNRIAAEETARRKGEEAAMTAEQKKADDKAAREQFAATAAKCGYAFVDGPSLKALAVEICKKASPTATDLRNACLLRNADWKLAIATVTPAGKPSFRQYMIDEAKNAWAKMKMEPNSEAIAAAIKGPVTPSMFGKDGLVMWQKLTNLQLCMCEFYSHTGEPVKASAKAMEEVVAALKVEWEAEQAGKSDEDATTDESDPYAAEPETDGG